MSETTAPVAAGLKVKRRAFLVDVFIRLVKTKPLGTVGLAIVLLLFVVGIGADLIAPYGYNEVDLGSRLATPGVGGHVLGTDHLGRDLLSRIIYGARISMIVALGASSLAAVLYITIGVISGFFGGKVDMIIQRFVDAVMAFPGLVIMLTVISVLGPGLMQIVITLGILGGIGGRVRVVRSAVIAIKENVYVEAARAIGSPPFTTMMRHILPNIFAVIIINFTVEMGGVILTESTLSFLGFGIPPPFPSWGAMLSESGRRYMLLAPWMAVWPGLALSLVVYGINMLGDALRDLLDPRLRGGLGRYGRLKGVITK
ncbi:MAG: ABC transporter permease [Chloroflexi bacterium]|nr:ABC transporter permease [Chloroflexota bacterium]